MTPLEDVPLSPEAEELFRRIKPQIESELEKVKRTPVSILVWGPSPNNSSSISSFRIELRKDLRANGHAAFFSEELCDESLSFSIRIQQIVQAKQFDLIISFPCTPGSIGEAHDFAADRRVNSHMLIFLNRQYLEGYSSQSLQALSSFLSCKICYYDDENDLAIVKEEVYCEVDKIREIKYLLDGRY